MRINIFGEINWNDFSENFKNQLIEEIKSRPKDYILSVDEQEFKNYLHNKFTLEELKILKESEQIIEIGKTIRPVKDFGMEIDRDFFNFIIKYNYSGSSLLFKISPSHFVMRTYKVDVDNNQYTISFSISIGERNAQLFNNLKNKTYDDVFCNLDNINRNAQGWNSNLMNIINNEFDLLKSNYLKDNDFFEAINVRHNKSTETIFTTPTIKKKIIPTLPSKTNKEFSSVPTMSNIMYEDILKIIYESGQNMERKPSLYKGKDEEGLRDQFLFILETRYESTTATGETFNKGGKTDLLMKYSKDNSNLFIAECKFWHGQSEFHQAISQLFDKYLTWRDSKVALIFFVTNKDFTNVLKSIKEEAKKNEYFVKYIDDRNDSSFSYIFRLPQDPNKEIFLEILAFHYVDI